MMCIIWWKCDKIGVIKVNLGMNMEQKVTKTDKAEKAAKPTKAVKTQAAKGAASAKKNKSTGLIVGIVVAVIVVIAAVVAIVMAVNSGKGDDAGTDATTSENSEKKGTKTVGDEEYGYLVVPEDWEKIEAQEGFQYGNSEDGYYVSILVEDASELNAEDWAKGVEAILQQGNAEDMKTGKEKLGNVGEAHVVSGFYKAYDRWLKAYVVESGDKVYYVAVEGPDKDSEEFKVPESFKTEK